MHLPHLPQASENQWRCMHQRRTHLHGPCITASAGGPCITASVSLQRVRTGGPGFQHFLKCQGTCKVLECSLLWNKQTMSNKTTSGEHYSIFPYNHHVSQSFAWPHPIIRAIQNMRANLCHLFKRNSKIYWTVKTSLMPVFLHAKYESASLQIFIRGRAFVFLISSFSTKHRYVRVIIQLPPVLGVQFLHYSWIKTSAKR